MRKMISRIMLYRKVCDRCERPATYAVRGIPVRGWKKRTAYACAEHEYVIEYWAGLWQKLEEYRSGN